MTTSPTVSVITPTYNRADFIGEAVESVIGQSYPDWELIIVDDGSSDGTEEIIRGYMERDPRIKYFYQENQGQSVARGFALTKSSGQYVCFLDSDNYWPMYKLEKSVAFFEAHPEVDIVYGDCICIDESGKEISRRNMKRYSGWVAPKLIKDNFVSMNTTMARKKCFDEMGGTLGTRRVADDYDLWLRFSARYRYHYIPEYLAYYRIMKDQISSDKTRRFYFNEEIIYDFRKQYPDVMNKRQFAEGFAFFHTRKARYLGSVGQKVPALREIGRALRYTPFSMVPIRGLAAVLLKRGKR